MKRVYTATDIGAHRRNNEDTLACIEPETYLVADGMGGYAAGEIASRLMADAAVEVIGARKNVDEAVLREAVLKANGDIRRLAGEKPEYDGMGTTATLFHRDGLTGVWAHVGDSRLYLWRQGMLHQVTTDHSLVSELVAKGTITPEEARQHPKRNVITRAVGVEKDIKIDTGSFPLQSGDGVLLCTDGLTTVLTDEGIGEILADPSLMDKARALVDRALDAGSRDNITAVFVSYDD